ncbi:hypothetical protein KUTeg_019053 [Tegillarca granosa]|uniref:Cadherin domain-containing protein n=1 Tax=Tegillarca granosa TaxID=220873 RepID=A0ABQ9EFH7_TEGGR|nr:hypothetical protein KUTeg_019053 [Tegillarca granosa]
MFIVYALLFIWINLVNSVDQVVGKTVSRINIPHDLPVNSIITKISVSGNIPLVEHLEEEANDLFKVLEGGELVTVGDLSRVLGRTFTFFTSYPHQKDSVFDILLLNIHNSSDLFTFTQHHYLSTIKENQPSDTVVNVYGHIQAQSKSSKDVKYSIKGENQHLFYLRHMHYLNSHEVKIVSESPFDREKRESYSLVIEATSSSGQTAQAVVTINIIDLNDNFPVFEKKIFKTTYNSNINGGTKILQVHATDADIDRITYLLHGTNDFRIDQSSGEIFAKHDAHLSAGVYSFSVTAQDSAGHSSAPSKVIIEVIPSVLKFESSHKISKRSVTHIEKQIQVMENGSSSDVLFSVASSPAPPPGVEQYRIVTASAEKFQVDTKGNVYVKQGESLDYENVEDRSITITFNITRTDQPQGVLFNINDIVA